MVDIKWAQDNCKVNTAKLRKIEEDAIKLESMLDESIKTACDNGKKNTSICIQKWEMCNESIKMIQDKYSNAGYTVMFYDSSNFEYIQVEW